MRVRSLGREDPLEEGMATRSSIPAWRIPWAEESGGLQSMGSQRVRHNRSDLMCTHFFTFTLCVCVSVCEYECFCGERLESKCGCPDPRLSCFPVSLG